MAETSLFRKAHLADFLQDRTYRLEQSSSKIRREHLLSYTADVLTKNLQDSESIEPLTLYLDQKTIDYEEVTMDLRETPLRHNLEPDERAFGPVTILRLHIPYSGDRNLFDFRPNEHFHKYPSAEVTAEEVIIRRPLFNESPEQVKEHLYSVLSEVQTYIQNQAHDFERHLGDSTKNLLPRVQQRIDQVTKEDALITNLGIPLRRRDDEVAAIPLVKRRLPIATQPEYSSVDLAQPFISAATYDEILKVLHKMAEVFERSPKFVSSMDEEEIRTLFLVLLNGTFDVKSTAETFNYTGKTDILLPVNGGNAFVAECKFWKGGESLKSAIDQLLGYVTWRDTKTAMILFNRNKNFQGALQSARAAAANHPQFHSTSEYQVANGFRGLYRHPDDHQRIVTITTLMFDVPTYG